MSIDFSFFSFLDGYLFKAGSNEDLEELFDALEESGYIQVNEDFIDLEAELFPAIMKDLEQNPSQDPPILITQPYLLEGVQTKEQKKENPYRTDVLSVLERIFDDSDIMRAFECRRGLPLTKRELYEFLKSFFVET